MDGDVQSGWPPGPSLRVFGFSAGSRGRRSCVPPGGFLHLYLVSSIEGGAQEWRARLVSKLIGPTDAQNKNTS